MTHEWTVEQIRYFTKAGHQSVFARMVKCLLDHYEKDMEAFAEWCMIELRFYDGCYIRGKKVYDTIQDCRDDWEVETGRKEATE